jgi:hypothetical protein
MRWKFVSWVILLACLILPAVPVLAGNGSVTVTGTVPLAIYDVSASHVGFHNATISWKTNSAAISQLFYDTEFHSNLDDYRYSTREPAKPVSEDKVRLNKLLSSTTYHYRIKAVAIVDGTECIAVSDDYIFTTDSWFAGPSWLWKWWRQ